VQLAEVATQQKDKNKTAHEGSGTTDTITPCEGAAYLHELNVLATLFATVYVRVYIVTFNHRQAFYTVLCW